MSIIKFLFSKIERSLIGKMWLQPFYESLHRISIRGMNYMQSQEINKTGEITALKYANQARKGTTSVVLFDVGANTGQYVQAMADTFKNNYTIHSFEPSKLAYSILSIKNLENVKFYNFGFSDSDKQMKLYSSGSVFGTVYPLSHESIDNNETITLTTIDRFCREHSIEKIYYLKIDVEGAELDVLRGAEGMLRNGKIQFVQFEFGPNSLEARIYLRDFFRTLVDYDIYRIMKDGLRLIEEYNEIIEIPLTGNYLSKRRGNPS